MPTKSENYFEEHGYSPKGTKKCKNCGEEMKIYLNRDFERKKFCSRSCACEYRQRNNEKMKEATKKNLAKGRTEEVEQRGAQTYSENYHKGKYPKVERALKRGWEMEKDYPHGPDHWAWKEDRSKIKKSRYNASERTGEITWWRNSIYRRDDYTCQKCGERGGKLRAHHIENWADNPDKRFELDNGITLCKSCHDELHSKFGYRKVTKKDLEEFMAGT